MPRIAAAILALAVWIYGIIDCAHASRMPAHLPKWLWLCFVIFVPGIGSLMWIVLRWITEHPEEDPVGAAVPGNQADKSSHPSQGFYRRFAASRKKEHAPDDDPEFLKKLEAHNAFEKWERSQLDNDSHNNSDAASTDGTNTASKDEGNKEEDASSTSDDGSGDNSESSTHPDDDPREPHN
ncbi:MAG: PLD nuclease N-terminal domain-containing protein [Actinomycetaceae bacterium]|nr:PLD nuclease N-terminal domain-containing protein [Actinomycetaceae bacterium]MDY6082679.1 PLD nuclease N-terminal domain-containing protein [Actinomycetaceae bacterium]